MISFGQFKAVLLDRVSPLILPRPRYLSFHQYQRYKSWAQPQPRHHTGTEADIEAVVDNMEQDIEADT